MNNYYRTLIKVDDEWNPSKLFIGGINGGYYNPNIMTSLFQDDAGTVPVNTDGQVVAIINDLSGNNHHLVQTDNTKRPIFRTDGINNWLELNGDDMQSNISNFGGDCFVFAKLQHNTPPSAQYKHFGIDIISPANSNLLLLEAQNNLTGRIQIRGRNAGGVGSSGIAQYTSGVLNGSFPFNTLHTYLGQSYNDRSLELYRDNILITTAAPTGTVGTLTNVRIILGNSAIAGSYFPRFYGGVICNKVATADERDLINNFFT
jgi:hypothetical protein